VEQALQLSVEEEIHKEGHARAWATIRATTSPCLSASTASRVPNWPRSTMKRPARFSANACLCRLADFTYWLFGLRMRRQDKARVASDTRKGLAQLTRMELAVSERRHGTRLDEAGFASRFPGP